MTAFALIGSVWTAPGRTSVPPGGGGGGGGGFDASQYVTSTSTFTDNGDGTATTASATDNGDGTWTGTIS